MRGTSGSVRRSPANPARPGREQRYRDHFVRRGVPEVPLICSAQVLLRCDPRGRVGFVARLSALSECEGLEAGAFWRSKRKTPPLKRRETKKLQQRTTKKKRQEKYLRFHR